MYMNIWMIDLCFVLYCLISVSFCNSVLLFWLLVFYFCFPFIVSTWNVSSVQFYCKISYFYYSYVKSWFKIINCLSVFRFVAFIHHIESANCKEQCQSRRLISTELALIEYLRVCHLPSTHLMRCWVSKIDAVLIFNRSPCRWFSRAIQVIQCGNCNGNKFTKVNISVSLLHENCVDKFCWLLTWSLWWSADGWIQRYGQSCIDRQQMIPSGYQIVDMILQTDILRSQLIQAW